MLLLKIVMLIIIMVDAEEGDFEEEGVEVVDAEEDILPVQNSKGSRLIKGGY